MFAFVALHCQLYAEHLEFYFFVEFTFLCKPANDYGTDDDYVDVFTMMMTMLVVVVVTIAFVLFVVVFVRKFFCVYKCVSHSNLYQSYVRNDG